MRSKCENRERIDSGLPCEKPATWAMRVGNRESDKQYSCSDCLPWVAEAMYTAEDRPGMRVTLERLHDR
jgi:hypothetical protein